MPVPISSTLGILGDNLHKRKSALPLSRRTVSAWARGLDIPRGGATVLYTGQMWQMVPAINAMSRQLGKYENSRSAWLFGFARSMNRLVNLTPLLARTRPHERRAYNERLRNIARLLRAAGVEFGYLYEKDLYSGALVYDEGLDRAFARHAEYVYRTLKEAGVRQVITVDPHTTNMLRSVYPKVVPGFDIGVRSYLEVLMERKLKPLQQLGQDVTIHDSCVYARSEGVLEQPRRLLAGGGVTVIEPELSGKLTFCCGGPLETLFPGKSAEIARQRMVQLSACSSNVVTACPLCLANLNRVAPTGVEVRDVSDYLVRAYCPVAVPA
ncbi:MAG TPA: (Fe-S)-binding protein [Thermoplasmata archaeon]|nr:(Fe-S)-binding protein [Thermoplasmata archaeon]